MTAIVATPNPIPTLNPIAIFDSRGILDSAYIHRIGTMIMKY